MTLLNHRASSLRRLADLLDKFPDLPNVHIGSFGDGTEASFDLSGGTDDYSAQKAQAGRVMAAFSPQAGWRSEKYGLLGHHVQIVGDDDVLRVQIILDPVRRTFDIDPAAILLDITGQAVAS